MEEELKSREKVLEVVPQWATKVPKLEETLVVHGQKPGEGGRSTRFLAMNIIAEEPHVLFV